MPVPSQLSLSNQALAALPAKEISSLNENSLEARECRRFYPHVMAQTCWRGRTIGPSPTVRTPLALKTPTIATRNGSTPMPASQFGSPIRVIPDLAAGHRGSRSIPRRALCRDLGGERQLY
jgi:hypothetical protein